MIILSGLRAAGKTTICNFLESEGFWCFDTGPFWRKFRDLIAPEMNVGELHLKMREYTGDEHWEDNFLAATISNLYEQGLNTKKDLVLSGYRNVEEALYVVRKLDGIIFPVRETSVWYVEAPLEVAFKRFREREGENVTIDDLVRHQENERKRGAEKFRDIADIIIDNSHDTDVLHFDVSKIIYERLGYTFEGNINSASKERK